MENGCLKCGSQDADSKTVSMTGGALSKVFDVQNNKFEVVFCKNCGYSEFYNKEASAAGNVFDFFFGG
ncbi:zinc ribbon domain-containing protein [Alkalibacillus salilacus]|uniref:Nucleic-acid-binding Zn-ribbon protein n=1 Tax=Alkalibacillus salilacus TaxID=284582 RepID=A0ABT9VIM7_9BACI|nr:zinc ribbon domain-containing protein [Alkalibacillus salilacus]MDQ0160828.1 putative nucleic-acid-binding Zn-ribbon protein [Alkalibacillus salilacus]